MFPLGEVSDIALDKDPLGLLRRGSRVSFSFTNAAVDDAESGETPIVSSSAGSQSSWACSNSPYTSYASEMVNTKYKTDT